MAHFRPADHSKGDANTIGGYMAVHDRPAAFEGIDGFSYSVEILVDETEDARLPYSAYLLFVKWARIGAQTPEGHLETPYLSSAETADQARRRVGAMRLDDVKRELDRLVAERSPAKESRRWWDAMRDDDGESQRGGSGNGVPQ